MATVTQEIPAQTDDILKPAGQGTPVSQWWECCLPKTPSSQMKGASGPDGTSPRKQHVSFQDDHTIETVDKNKGVYNRTLIARCCDMIIQYYCGAGCSRVPKDGSFRL